MDIKDNIKGMLQEHVAEIEAAAAQLTKEAMWRGIMRGVAEAMPGALPHLLQTAKGGSVPARESDAKVKRNRNGRPSSTKADPPPEEHHAPSGKSKAKAARAPEEHHAPSGKSKAKAARAKSAAPVPVASPAGPGLGLFPRLEPNNEESNEEEVNRFQASPNAYFSPGQAAALAKVAGQRRPPETMERLEGAALHVIVENPGLRAEELARLIGLPPRDLRDVFVRLCGGGGKVPRVSTTGEKHGMRYYPLPKS